MPSMGLFCAAIGEHTKDDRQDKSDRGHLVPRRFQARDNGDRFSDHSGRGQKQGKRQVEWSKFHFVLAKSCVTYLIRHAVHNEYIAIECANDETLRRDPFCQVEFY